MSAQTPSVSSPQVALFLGVVTLAYCAIPGWRLRATWNLLGPRTFNLMPAVLGHCLHCTERWKSFLAVIPLIVAPACAAAGVFSFQPMLYVYSFALGVVNLLLLAQPPTFVLLGSSGHETIQLKPILSAVSPAHRTVTMLDLYRSGHLAMDDNPRGLSDSGWAFHVTKMIDLAPVLVIDLGTKHSDLVEREIAELMEPRRIGRTIFFGEPEDSWLRSVLRLQAPHWAHSERELHQIAEEAISSCDALQKFSRSQKWVARTRWDAGNSCASIEVPSGWMPMSNPNSFVASFGKVRLLHATRRAQIDVKCSPAVDGRVNPDSRKCIIAEYLKGRSPKWQVDSETEIAGERNTVVGRYLDRAGRSGGGLISVVHSGVEHHMEWEAARGFESFAMGVLATLRLEA